MNRGQAGPLTWQVKPSKLVVAQRQIPVSPFDIGTRTLENLSELFGLLLEVALGLGTQLTQGPTGLKQRACEDAGEFPKRLAIADGASLGHAIEIKGGDELGVHGEGGGRCQVQLIDLLSHITGDELNGGLHFGYHPLGFIDAIETSLAELFVLGNGANRLDLSTDI